MKKGSSTNQFRLAWLILHISWWAMTQAFSSSLAYFLNIAVSRIIGALACSIEIAERNWGGTCSIFGIDVGMALGLPISTIIVVLIGGVVAGLGQWWILNRFFQVPKQRKLILIIFGGFTTLIISSFTMFSGMLNVFVGDISLLFERFVAGFFFGGVFGSIYGFMTLLIFNQQKDSKTLILSKPAKYLIGFGTAWLVIYPILFMGVWFSMVVSFGFPEFIPESEFLSPTIPFFLIIPLHCITMILQLLLLLFYLVHVIKNNIASETARIILGVGCFFMPFVAMPIYYYLYIWRDIPPKWAMAKVDHPTPREP